MPYSPILLAHICGGTLGLLSGTAAMCFRKGSPRHVMAGKVFVASMLTMGAVATYLAITKHQPNNIGGGILTFYLIGTAWLTARRRDGETSRFDWVALLIPLAIGILNWMNGLKVVRSGASSQDGVPVGMIFFMGPSNRPLRLLSTVGLGKYLSPALFSTTLYLILTILPLILLIFWLVRVRFTNAYNGKSMPRGDEGPSLPAAN